MKKYILLLILLLFNIVVMSASDTIIGNVSAKTENKSSTSSLKFSYKHLILPAVVMAYGTVETVLAPKHHLLNYTINRAIIDYQPKRIHIDDYLQYAPTVGVYALNLFGVKGKNRFLKRTVILGMSALFVAATVNTIKYTAKIERPDGSTRNSFPSGHTSVAFMGAEFLWQEYKDVSIWYGVAGYSIAATTGCLRMYNNRHWFGDVLFGAGIGMLSVKLAYWLSPFVDKIFTHNDVGNDKMSLIPYYNGEQGGLSFAIKF